MIGTLIYVIAIQLVTGMIVGSLFPVGMLVVLLSLEIISLSALTFAYGPVTYLSWLAVVATLQIGYLVGVLARGLLEQTRISQVGVHRRRIF